MNRAGVEFPRWCGEDGYVKGELDPAWVAGGHFGEGGTVLIAAQS